MKDGHAEFAIVGAGLAGCTAAILLARAGRSVALIEKRPFPRRKVCGECLAASNLPLLERLGVLEAVSAEAGDTLARVTLNRGGRSVVAPLPALPGGAPSGHGLAIGRDAFDRILRDAAVTAGATLLQPWTVLGTEAPDGDDSLHRLTLRETRGRATRELRADVLIDAHGSWEALALVGDAAARPARPSDLLAFKANFHGAALPNGEIAVLALDGGYGGLVQEARGRLSVACCVRRDRLAELRRAHAGPAGEAVERWLRAENAIVAAALAGATREGRWLASGPLAPGIRAGDSGRAWLAGGSRQAPPVLRVGNAAGEAHPILGEGMSMALQSSALLAERLLAADALTPIAQARLERAFGRAYRRRFAVRMALAAGFAHVAMRPRTAAALLGLSAALPALLTTGARIGGKVRVPPLEGLPDHRS